MKANSQFISGIVLCMGLIISAACNADNLVWSELSAEQRSMLADHQGEWGGYSVKRQKRLASGANRWLTMTDVQRSQVLKSFERWGGLSQEQQSRVQKNFKKFQTFSKAEKAKLKQLRERFKAMPDQQRSAVRKLWKQMEPADKQRLRVSMLAMTDDERERFVSLLKSLPMEERYERMQQLINELPEK